MHTVRPYGRTQILLHNTIGHWVVGAGRAGSFASVGHGECDRGQRPYHWKKIKSLFIRTCLKTDFNFLASAKLVILGLNGWVNVVRSVNRFFSLVNPDRGGSKFSSIFLQKHVVCLGCSNFPINRRQPNPNGGCLSACLRQCLTLRKPSGLHASPLLPYTLVVDLFQTLGLLCSPSIQDPHSSADPGLCENPTVATTVRDPSLCPVTVSAGLADNCITHEYTRKRFVLVGS